MPRNESGIKVFSDEGKLAEFVASRSKRIAKGSFSDSGDVVLEGNLKLRKEEEQKWHMRRVNTGDCGSLNGFFKMYLVERKIVMSGVFSVCRCTI